MDSTPSRHKPYSVYRTGEARGGARPPRRRRRRRRGLGLALVVLVVFAGSAGAAVAVWQPFTGGAAAADAGAPAGAQDTAGADASPAASASPEATTAAASPSPAPTPADPPTIIITGGGDVLGDRNIRDLLAASSWGPFKHIAPIFQKSDFGFVNLETPLTSNGDPQTWKDVVFKGDPKLAAAMAKSGINVVTLANNHAGDQGDTGVLDSIKHCERAGVTLVGAGKDLDTAMAGEVLEAKGAKVAFLGFTDVLPVGFPATASSPGVAPGRSDLGAVKKAIKAAAKRADYVAVAWHWNFEFTTAPSSLEVSEGKAAIDAGADVVYAHHPHVLQGVQVYNGGLICYSLGDLVFDNCSGPMAQTVLVRTKISEDRLDATLIPVQIDIGGTPRVATGANGQSILQRVKRYSASLGTKVKISGGKGYVHVKR